MSSPSLARSIALALSVMLSLGWQSAERTLAAPECVTGFGERLIAVPDLDGDGTTDLAVSSCTGLPLVRLFSGATGAPLGDLGGIELRTSWEPRPESHRLCAVRGADGDCAGIVVGETARERDGEFSCGWVGMYAPATRQLVWESWGEAQMEIRGVALAALPDVDGDGCGDVAVGTGECVTRSGDWLPPRVFVLSGRSGATLAVIGAPAPDHCAAFGGSLASFGDIDGDGVPDLAIGAIKQPLGRSAGDCVPCIARVYIASADGLRVRRVFEGSRADGADAMLAAVPDLDGDGAADLAVGLCPGDHADFAGNGRVLALSSATGAILADGVGALPGKVAWSNVVADPDLSEEQLEISGSEADFAQNVAFFWSQGEKVAVAVGDPELETGMDRSGSVAIRPLR